MPWFEILQEFERQLARVDLLAAELAGAGVVLSEEERAAAGWVPVGAVGPLPDTDRQRALAILEAQRVAMAQLERLRVELARHIGMTRAASSRTPDSIYLDRSA